MTTVREFCLHLLESPRLEDKLASPRETDGAWLADDDPGAPVFVDAPARTDGLQMRSGSRRLPKMHELKDPAARVVSLERFAHHELTAIELFAWALLLFPEAPAPMRRGLLITLEEEQLHLQLYLRRLEELGGGLGERPLSDYLWRHVGAIRDASDPVGAFLSAVGLTFEQANLDYAAMYTEAFAKAGDDVSADIMRRVHDDEIGHVQLAATWLRRLRETDDLVRAYEDTVPFPLGASRAKGRRFDDEARRAAGLDEAFIDYVRHARPSHQQPASKK
jgi:uncharacterized ferritin-like protein (DUF455 family)